MILKITAAELQQGDVWLGEDGVKLRVQQRPLPRRSQFIPWERGRNQPAVPMDAITVTGLLSRPGHDTYAGRWTLQADMPIEVEREV